MESGNGGDLPVRRHVLTGLGGKGRPTPLNRAQWRWSTEASCPRTRSVGQTLDVAKKTTGVRRSQVVRPPWLTAGAQAPVAQREGPALG